MDASGKALDRKNFSRLLKEYYRLRGWDEETELLTGKQILSFPFIFFGKIEVNE